MSPRASALIADANVLIDYADIDRTVLVLLAKHVAPVYVAKQVLAKVDALDEGACAALGLRIAEPSLSQLTEASERRSRLAFDDRLCLILARDNCWRCITNDRALRRECAKASVAVIWGLEVMLEIIAAGALPAGDAIEVARAIHTSNPSFIPLSAVQRFEEKALKLASSQRQVRGSSGRFSVGAVGLQLERRGGERGVTPCHRLRARGSRQRSRPPSGRGGRGSLGGWRCRARGGGPAPG